MRAARHPVRRRQGRHQVQPAPALAAPSSSASRAASPTRSATTSAPSTTSRRPTSAPTRQIMVWMMDTYMNVVGFADKNADAPRRHRQDHRPPAARYGRETATGQGVVHCIAEWAERPPLQPQRLRRFIVQGFGNVGSQRRQDPGHARAPRWSPSATTRATSPTPRASTRTSSPSTWQKTGSVEGYQRRAGHHPRRVLRHRAPTSSSPPRSSSRSARPRPRRSSAS